MAEFVLSSSRGVYLPTLLERFDEDLVLHLELIDVAGYPISVELIDGRFPKRRAYPGAIGLSDVFRRAPKWLRPRELGKVGPWWLVVH